MAPLPHDVQRQIKLADEAWGQSLQAAAEGDHQSWADWSWWAMHYLAMARALLEMHTAPDKPGRKYTRKPGHILGKASGEPPASA